MVSSVSLPASFRSVLLDSIPIPLAKPLALGPHRGDHINGGESDLLFLAVAGDRTMNGTGRKDGFVAAISLAGCAEIADRR